MADEPQEKPEAQPEAVEQSRPIKAKPRPRKAAKAAPKQEREASSIAFPYMDLEAGISVAKAILNGGGVALTRDQLAGVMNLAAGSGNFVSKVATARNFGLVAYNANKYELTDLGFEVADSDEKRQRAARAAAFLNVPLYRRTYDEFRGRQLPPRPHGLEQAFVRFGVAQKQKTNARLAFDKSAAQAGYFANGSDRLIEPIVGPVTPAGRGKAQEEEVEQESDNRRASRSEPTDSGSRHPFVQGLLDTLPEPGTNWAIEGRAKWLQAASNIFDLIYKGSGDILITAKPGDQKE